MDNSPNSFMEHPTQPSPGQRVSIWRLLGAVLSVALLIYLIAAQGWEEFFAALRSIPPVAVAAAFAVILCSRLFVALRWYVLLRAASVSIGPATCMRLVFMGLFASNFLPTTVGGDLVRLAGLMAHHPVRKSALDSRIDPAVAAASLLVDRLVGMAGMAVFLPFGVARLLAGETAAQSTAFLGGLWQRGWKFVQRLIASAGTWLRTPLSLLLAFLCTLGHSVCTFLSVWLLLDGMGEPVPFLWVGGLWSLSYFISLMPVSINGLGLQEVSIAALYTQFGGVSPQAGLALAVLMRVLFMIASAPGAVFLPDILRPLSQPVSRWNNKEKGS